MPEHDTSNLPILDDIVQAGDADNTAHPPPSKPQVPSASDGQLTDALPDSQNQIASEAPAGKSTDATGSRGDNPADGGTNRTSAPAPPAATAPHTSQAEATVPHHGGRNISSIAPDLDKLTEEIMRSVRPGMERLLRQTIRQTLEKQFPGEHKSD